TKKNLRFHKFFYGLRAKTFFKSFRQPTMMSRRPASSVFLHGRVKECSRPAAVYKFSDPSRKFRPTLRNPWDDNTSRHWWSSFFKRGASRNERALTARPPHGALLLFVIIAFPHHVGIKIKQQKIRQNIERFGRREWTLSCRRACSRHPIDE